jgi:hypothetical protein
MESIASLRRRKDDLAAEKSDVEVKMNLCRQQLDILNSRISAIRQKIKGQNETLTVSDHAIVRYIERVIGDDIPTMKRTLADAIEPMFKSLGDGDYPFLGGTATVRGGVIVTITT